MMCNIFTFASVGFALGSIGMGIYLLIKWLFRRPSSLSDCQVIEDAGEDAGEEDNSIYWRKYTIYQHDDDNFEVREIWKHGETCLSLHPNIDEARTQKIKWEKINDESLKRREYRISKGYPKEVE